MAVTQRSTSLAAGRTPRIGTKRPVAPRLRADNRWQGEPEPEPEAEETSDLLATIESEIIPRLAFAHRADPLSPTLCPESRQPPTEAELAEFARIATCHDLSGALAFVESLARQGLSLEILLLELVGATARLLGTQWETDLRSFTEVSAGLGTLQQVVHILGPSFAPTLPHRGLVVLVAAPGEQHTLGLYMVGEFLRRAGWGVQVAPTISNAGLVDLVATERVEMLGISVSNDELLRPLAGLIESVQGASCNPDMSIMLGGPLELSDYATQCGVSLCTSDPRDAVRWLERHANLTMCRN